MWSENKGRKNIIKNMSYTMSKYKHNKSIKQTTNKYTNSLSITKHNALQSDTSSRNPNITETCFLLYVTNAHTWRNRK